MYYSDRSNAEADIRIQPFSIKPGIKDLQKVNRYHFPYYFYFLVEKYKNIKFLDGEILFMLTDKVVVIVI